MILVRHGLMIVGGPDSAKSSMYKSLAIALGHMQVYLPRTHSHNS